MAGSSRSVEATARQAFADRFRIAEHLLYAAIAIALALASFILFVDVVYRSVKGVVADDIAIADAILTALDGLLLVFMITELLHTVRAILAENALLIEPFLYVGIIAAIRRIIVASAEASDEVGTPVFDDLMVEIGILVAAVLILGVTIVILHQANAERPEHEPDDPDD